jgi:hypothetical protein
MGEDPEAVAAAQRPRLADRDDPHMPDWMHPAAYVQTGYRINYSSADALRSIFEVHNETVNIWTEFGPMIFFLVCFVLCVC